MRIFQLRGCFPKCIDQLLEPHNLAAIWHDLTLTWADIELESPKNLQFILSGWQKRLCVSDFLMSFTLPETNSSHLKRDYFNRKYIFQPSIFSCKKLVSGRVMA